MSRARASRIVFFVHYFPPINSTGSKRVEALSKYFVRAGRSVTVITSCKTRADGSFTEPIPDGVETLEINAFGRLAHSVNSTDPTDPPRSDQRSLGRRFKRLVQRLFGQIPDPRLPFALGLLSPLLAPEVKRALREADVVIASMPPWPTHLAALFVRWRFGSKIVLDYRDQFSANHIMAGTSAAKWLECRLDGFICRRADSVVVISEPMGEYYSQFNRRVGVVMNGYDAEILDDVRARLAAWIRPPSAAVTVRYLGKISRDRIPRALLSAVARQYSLGNLRSMNARFEFYGECTQLERVLDAEYPSIRGLFHFLPAVPYRNALALMLTADYLLFIETSDQSSHSARGVLTTKLFEYLGCGRPIIAEIDPETEAGRLIRRSSEIHVVSRNSADLESVFVAPPPNGKAEIDFAWIKSLSRSAQAAEYLKILDGLTGASLS